MHVVTVDQSDPATVSDLCLDGSQISRLACSFLMLMLTSPLLALYVIFRYQLAVHYVI